MRGGRSAQGTLRSRCVQGQESHEAAQRHTLLAEKVETDRGSPETGNVTFLETDFTDEVKVFLLRFRDGDCVFFPDRLSFQFGCRH